MDYGGELSNWCTSFQKNIHRGSLILNQISTISIFLIRYRNKNFKKNTFDIVITDLFNIRKRGGVANINIDIFVILYLAEKLYIKKLQIAGKFIGILPFSNAKYLNMLKLHLGLLARKISISIRISDKISVRYHKCHDIVDICSDIYFIRSDITDLTNHVLLSSLL